VNTLATPEVSRLLDRLFREAEETDAPFIAEMMDGLARGEDPLGRALAAERDDYRGVYRRTVDNFLCVAPHFGRLLYLCARACGASRIVEFGTSFGISTIHLACAVRDNGGGVVIGTELEPSKVERALANVRAAGLEDVVHIRAGDALDTLTADLGGPVDLVHLDGALSLYAPVLRLVQPHLRGGAIVVAENATPDYLAYVRDPANGFEALPVPFEDARGNYLSMFAG
jgi:predicted O-methyltransferase YrrM